MTLQIERFNIQCVNSLKEIKRCDWQIVGMELPPYASYEFLLTIEELHADQFEFKYLLIKEGNVCRGLIYLECIFFSGSKVLPFVKYDGTESFFKRIALKLAYKLLPKFQWNLLSTGNTFLTGDAGIYIHQDIDQKTKEELLIKAFKIADQASKYPIHLYMMNNIYDDVDASNQYYHNFIKTLKFAAYPVDPDMDIGFLNHFDSFESYQKSLTSKYRVRLRKVKKVSDAVTCRSLGLEELNNLKDEIYDLYKCVADNVEFNIGWLAKDYFLMLKTKFSEVFFVDGYFLDGKIVGFYSYFRWDYLMIHFMGIDYEHNKQYKLYNRMLLDMVEKGIHDQASFIHLGRTATEIKSTVGAKPRTMKIYLRHKSNWKNRIMKRFEDSFGTGSFLIRDPFKKMVVKDK